MSHYQPSVSLHQQDGGLTVQAFAAQHGLTVRAIRNCIKAGRVVGARQDARSKKWTIYPPAKLVDKSGDTMKRREPSACQAVEKLPAVAQAMPDGGENFTRAALGSVEVVDVGTSPHGLSADGVHLVQEICERLSPAPSGKPVLAGVEVLATPGEGLKTILNKPVLPGEAAKRSFNAFEGFDGGGDGQRSGQAARAAQPANVYRDPEIRCVLQSLREAAARQFREGLHYLRLDAHEFAQLYAALDNDRSRVRKLVGKGVLPVGLLRCSDSVWQKMQAMSRKGRLL